MKKEISKPLSLAQKAELRKLATLSDAEIDTREMPEQKDWTGARRGIFYRPVKQQLTLRLDADVIDWFKSQAPDGQGYQTSINAALREHVARCERG